MLGGVESSENSQNNVLEQLERIRSNTKQEALALEGSLDISCRDSFIMQNCIYQLFFFYSFRGGRISIFPRFFLLTARVRKVRLLKAEHRKGSSSELKTSNMIQLKSRSVFFFF